MIETKPHVHAVDARYLRDQLIPPPPAARPSQPMISVIIPTLNEAENVGPVLSGLPACVAEIIVVDGHSEDSTPEVAFGADPRVRIILERRKGKGAAMLSGMAAARGHAIVALDADGSMDPADVIVFQALLGAGYDLVKGSREAVGGGSEDFSLVRRVGNFGLTRLANTMHGTRWSDMCYGYFGFWRDVLPVVHLDWETLTTRALALQLSEEGSRARQPSGAKPAYGHGFEIETALFLRAARARLRIAEVPSCELARTSGESHLRTVRDGWRVLSAIARERQSTKSEPPSADVEAA